MENMPSPNIQFYYMREGRQTPATAARPSQPQEADQRGQTWFGRWGSAHPAPVALPQLSTLQRGPAASCVVQSHSALRSRHQHPCGLSLRNLSSPQFTNKVFFLDCYVPVTSPSQAVISMSCESSPITAILLADSDFCQLYSTRDGGYTSHLLLL